MPNSRKIADPARERPTAKKPSEWSALLLKAIKKAKENNDPRFNELQNALGGKAEETLRKYGILSEADLNREF